MDKLRLGIVGVGRMGLAHIENQLAGLTPSIVIPACADTDPEREAVLSSKLPEARFFDSADGLFESGLVDACLIATPHYFHPPIAISAFAHGIHVLSEKPAGVYCAQVQEAIDAAERSELVYAMMFNQRTNPVFKTVRELVRGGEYGELHRFNWIITDWFRSQEYYDTGAWRATWSGEGGGVLMNQAVHQLDLTQWICGMPDKITAVCSEGKWHDVEVEDDVFMSMEFPNGATGCFVTSTGDAPGTNRLEITLDKAVITVDDAARITLKELDRGIRDSINGVGGGFTKPAVSSREIPVVGDDPEHPAVVEAFARRILYGEPLIAEGREGMNTVELINAAYMSSWLGHSVKLPTDHDRFKELLDGKIAGSKEKKNVLFTREAFKIEKYK